MDPANCLRVGISLKISIYEDVRVLYSTWPSLVFYEDVRVVKETGLRSVGASLVGSTPTPRKKVWMVFSKPPLPPI